VPKQMYGKGQYGKMKGGAKGGGGGGKGGRISGFKSAAPHPGGVNKSRSTYAGKRAAD
jgi:hypothetical protein